MWSMRGAYEIAMPRRLLPLSACMLCLYPVCVWGQATNSADVTGSVTDPSGAVVPGVTVIVRDIDKNTERTFVTNDSGLYDTGPLVPSDQYLITFKKEGFATLQRGPMTLTTGVTGMNVQLTLGPVDATDQYSWKPAAPLLETTTAEISSTVPQETLKLLPQTGGIPDWQSFLTFLPGTRGNGDQQQQPGYGWRVGERKHAVLQRAARRRLHQFADEQQRHQHADLRHPRAK